jgi:tRNA G46 methylase TrmB
MASGVSRIPTAELVRFLKFIRDKNLGIITNLKCKYRPYICPFDDWLSFIPRNQRVVDIGCGAGRFLHLVAEHRQPNALAGLDTQPVLIDAASARLNSMSIKPLCD